MDNERATRIERKLDELTRDMVSRDESDRRFDRLERKIDKTLEELSAQGRQLAIVQTKLEGHDGFDERIAEVEEVAAQHRGRVRARGWVWPTVASAAGVIVNAILTSLTFIASGGHHS